MGKINLEIIEQEYLRINSDLKKFSKSLQSQIEELLVINDINLGFPIQSRIKTIISIKEKIESGRFNVKKSALEIQDLVGFRIVLLFKRDVEAVEKLLTKNLKIVRQYNTDDKLLENQFGYSSKHFVVQIPDSWREVPSFKNLDKFFAEIQLRTLSQHNWAETSSLLQYKNETNVPREVLRSIGRVSALLETVDFELERLLVERENYNMNIEETLDKHQNLNVDSLSSILDLMLPPNNKTGREDLSLLLDDLLAFGIKTVEDIENLIEENLAIVIDEDKKAVDLIPAKNNSRFDQGVFYNFVGLVRRMLNNADKELWDDINKEKRKLKNNY